MATNLDRALDEIAGLLEDQGKKNIRTIKPRFKKTTGALLRSFEVEVGGDGDDFEVDFNSYGNGINDGYVTSTGKRVRARPFYSGSNNVAVQNEEEIQQILDDAVQADLDEITFE